MMPKGHRGSSCFLNPAVLGGQETSWEEPMPENVIMSVKREIGRLKREIGQRTSELAAVKDDLIKHQRAYRLLAGRNTGPRRPGRKRGRARRATPANWDSVLDRLPSRFTVGDIAKAAGARRKSSGYVRQVAVRWAKQKKTRRIGRGKYQKVEQGKSRAAAAPQRKK